MVMQRVRSFQAKVEHELGLPPLSQVAVVLDKFSDAKQLRLIRDVLVAAEAVSRNAPELDKVAILIPEINSMPIEKLDKLEKVLKRIERIMKNAPQNLLDFLTSLRE